jgi:hypothetical protein
MALTFPTAAEFKTFFARDFNFAPDDDADNLDYITDTDIDRAIAEAEIGFPELLDTDAQNTIAFMYLSAFHLVVNLQNSAKGISSQAKFPISGTSVAGVSVNFQIPERYSKDPFISQFTQNGYGMKYLSMMLPNLVGNVEISEGTTTVG